MPDLGPIYDATRRSLSDLVRRLSEDDLHRQLPATPGWSVRDVIAHLAGDVTCILAGDFPEQFFASFGDPEAVVVLNEWTNRHIEARRDRRVEEVLAEWEEGSRALLEMMNGSRAWPEGIPDFTGTVVLTDLAVHQQDVYGAFGEVRDRDAPPIRIATAGYVAVMGLRLSSDGVPPLRIAAGDSERVAGAGVPAAAVRAERFEMFRALSGRRNPAQISAFDWDGDPTPYLPYFYPYGVREEALVE